MSDASTVPDSRDPMAVLVTGAGGNLGRVLVPALLNAGHAVRTFDARGGDVTGDVRRADDVARAIDCVDAIVHAAALHVLVPEIQSRVGGDRGRLVVDRARSYAPKQDATRSVTRARV